MRIVKTTRTIGKKKWLGRHVWSGHSLNEADKMILEQLFGKNIIVLVPRKYEKEKANFLNIFEDTK